MSLTNKEIAGALREYAARMPQVTAEEFLAQHGVTETVDLEGLSKTTHSEVLWWAPLRGPSTPNRVHKGRNKSVKACVVLWKKEEPGYRAEIKLGSLTIRCKNYPDAVRSVADKYEKAKALPDYQKSLEARHRQTWKIPKSRPVGGQYFRDLAEEGNLSELDAHLGGGRVAKYQHNNCIVYLLDVQPLPEDPRFVEADVVTVIQQACGGATTPEVVMGTRGLQHLDSGFSITSKYPTRKAFLAKSAEETQRLEQAIVRANGNQKCRRLYE